jgi:hypothetical protein
VAGGERRRLPDGVTPRLLTPAQAAAYCGVSVERFEQTITLAPISCFGTRKLWDRRAIDLWLDRLSGIAEPTSRAPARSIKERLNGIQGAGS